jgi:hypothetical protein
MSTRKIRLTLSGTKINTIGPLIDIDFDNENLDVDVDVDAVSGESVLIKEYTVEAEAGSYDLEITYKNDEADDTTGDGEYDYNRTLLIEKIEYADNGTDYLPLIVTEANSNLEVWKNFGTMGYLRIVNRDNPNFDDTQPESDENLRFLGELNQDFDKSLPRTDDHDLDYKTGDHPGSNPYFKYQFVIDSIRIWRNRTSTFTIDFA